MLVRIRLKVLAKLRANGFVILLPLLELDQVLFVLGRVEVVRDTRFDIWQRGRARLAEDRSCRDCQALVRELGEPLVLSDVLGFGGDAHCFGATTRPLRRLALLSASALVISELEVRRRWSSSS